MTTVKERVTVLDTAIAEITERAARAAEHLARLDAQIEKAERRLARGTLAPEAPTPESRSAKLAAWPLVEEETKPATVRSKRTEASETAWRYEMIEGLITDRPMTNAELLEATGLTTVQVSSVLVNLQRRGRPVMNLGTERRARWFLAEKKGA